MVLDLVPSSIAKIVTDRVSIPIVGVGSGSHCDAQGLIISDVFGLSAGEICTVREALCGAGNHYAPGRQRIH